MIITEEAIGYLKYFDEKTKIGYVELLDGSHQEIYTHENYFNEAIKENDKVVFQIKENKHGWLAVNLKKLD